MNGPRRIGLIAWLATIVGCGYWFLVVGNSPWTALIVVPLLVPLAGMLAGRRRSFVWGGIVLLPYLALSIAEMIADPGARWLPSLTLAPGLLFVAILPAAARASQESS